MHISDLLPHIVSGDMRKYSEDGSYYTDLRHWQIRWLRKSWLYNERVVGWDSVEAAE